MKIIPWSQYYKNLEQEKLEKRFKEIENLLNQPLNKNLNKSTKEE
jgi:hypothetical protein